MTSTLLNGASDTKAFVVRRFKEGWDEYPAPAGKAGQVKFGWERGEAADAPHIHRLRSDLAGTYHWSGEAFGDYVFFVANWHPLLGMFLCHPNHPWTKVERFLMLSISLALTLVPSAFLAATLHRGGLLQVGEVLLTLVFVTLPDTVIGVVLYQLYVADTRCPLCAACIGGLRGLLAAIALSVGLLATIISSLVLSAVGANWHALLQPLIMGKLYSYATWFPIFMILPCIGFAPVWRTERKALEMGNLPEVDNSAMDDEGLTSDEENTMSA